MGRKNISIPIHGPLFKQIISTHGLAEVAKRIKVSRQMIHSWVTTERIPPRRLCDIVSAFDLSADTVRALNRTELTENEYREKVWRLEQENERLRKAIQVLCGEGEG